MNRSLPRPISSALICVCLAFCGCQPHFSISAPAAPPIQPSDYSVEDYTDDVDTYKDAMTPGATANPDLAKQKRNDIAYGLMGQIDVVYGAYYNQLFTHKGIVAVGGDFLTLGLSSAASIATHAATKTIFSALGTGFTGLNLSIDKNFFAQQTIPVIGLAMQTRRDKVRARIVENLATDTLAYPLLAAKRDLVAYFNAGTLASGLQELQEEAGVNTAATGANPAASKPPTPATLSAVTAGAAQVSLLWAPSAGATSYNLYFSTSTGVTPTNGTKINVPGANSFSHTGLTNGTTYFYVVTAVNANGESGPSPQASATPNVPPAPGGGGIVAPSGLTAQPAGSSQIALLWSQVPGAVSYRLYYATTSGVTTGNGTRVDMGAANNYTQSGLTNGTPYYFIVTAVDAGGTESPASSQVSATPNTVLRLVPPVLTPH